MLWVFGFFEVTSVIGCLCSLMGDWHSAQIDGTLFGLSQEDDWWFLYNGRIVEYSCSKYGFVHNIDNYDTGLVCGAFEVFDLDFSEENWCDIKNNFAIFVFYQIYEKKKESNNFICRCKTFTTCSIGRLKFSRADLFSPHEVDGRRLCLLQLWMVFHFEVDRCKIVYYFKHLENKLYDDSHQRCLPVLYIVLKSFVEKLIFPDEIN